MFSYVLAFSAIALSLVGVTFGVRSVLKYVSRLRSARVLHQYETEAQAWWKTRDALFMALHQGNLDRCGFTQVPAFLGVRSSHDICMGVRPEMWQLALYTVFVHNNLDEKPLTVTRLARWLDDRFGVGPFELSSEKEDATEVVVQEFLQHLCSIGVLRKDADNSFRKVLTRRPGAVQANASLEKERKAANS